MFSVQRQQGASLPLTNSDYVDHARGWVGALLWSECRGPKDWSEAPARVEAQYDIPVGVLRDLRYRPPKRIGVALYERLRAAYREMCERQMRLWKQELAEADAAHSIVARASCALAGKAAERSR